MARPNRAQLGTAGPRPPARSARGRRRWPGAGLLVLVAAACLPATAAEATSSEVGTPTNPTSSPTVYMAPNPPECATKWPSAVYHLTKVAAQIVEETQICAVHLGFEADYVIDADPRIWPLGHNENSCAMLILSTISTIANVIGDVQALMFVCFNINQGCAQAISKSVRNVISAGSNLAAASSACAPEGTQAPYFPNKDIPLMGFSCWTSVWSATYRLAKMAKYVDTAWSQCQLEEGRPPPTLPVPVTLPPPLLGANFSDDGNTSEDLGATASVSQVEQDPVTEWSKLRGGYLGTGSSNQVHSGEGGYQALPAAERRLAVSETLNLEAYE